MIYDLLYSYLLCVSLTLMLFFGLYFMVARVPNGEIYSNYLRSRKIMGVALLILTANYCVHFFAQLRFSHPDWAIFINLSTYFLSAWLFSSALTSLLNRYYLTRTRFLTHIGFWVFYTVISGVIFFFLGEGTYRNLAILSMALCFFVYAAWLAIRLLKTYRMAVRAMDNFYSDDVTVYIRWMSRFTYWAAVFGVAVGGLTFLPQEYIFIWILSAIPFYIYLYVSYLNYLLFCDRVQQAFDIQTDNVATQIDNSPIYFTGISDQLARWELSEGFTHLGFTVEDLAREVGTNRTYLTNYVKTTYNTSFREWIAALRIEHAKNLLIQDKNSTIAEIALSSGFRSLSYFTKIFTQREGCSPARWRKDNTK
jgi:AraC-like DNA-binding protein